MQKFLHGRGRTWLTPFIVIMLGFLLQWPTLATLAMFPVLVLVYRRLAIREEREVQREFCATYEEYARRTPRFVPRLHAEAPPTVGRWE